MFKVIAVDALQGFRLRVEFGDGISGVVDLSERLFGPVFEPLRDPVLFEQVSIDEFGAVAWPNGVDLAPGALHERLKRELAASQS